MSILFFLLSLFAITAFAHSPRQATRKCTRELESIIFYPASAQRDYLEGLSRQFRLTVRPSERSIEETYSAIRSFVQKYKVRVSLISPIKGSLHFNVVGTTTVGFSSYYPNTAQSYLNFGGFVKQVSDSNYYYTFSIESKDGQRYGVTFTLPFDPVS